MKKLLILSIVAVVVLMSLGSLTACTSSSTEKPVILRHALAYSVKDQFGEAFTKMANEFTENTGGKYILEAHCGETLCTVPESLDAVRTGAVELAFWPVGVFAMVDPAFASAELPFMFNNVEANAAACEPLIPAYSAILEAKYNQKVLCLVTATSLDLLSKKPVRTMDDMKGLLVQAINPATAAVAEYLGGSAVSISWTDAYTSLDKGVVDAGMYATNQMVMYHLDEVAKYCVPVYMVPTFLAATINLDVWNKLPSDIQDMLVEEHLKTADDLNTLWTQLVYSHPDLLASRGVDIYYLPEAERDRWREAVQPYTDEQLALMDPGFVTEFMKVVDEANAQYPYVQY
jgi:TRAP-type C4-dicarboxylate transport system substrate-binding protein